MNFDQNKSNIINEFEYNDEDDKVCEYNDINDNDCEHNEKNKFSDNNIFGADNDEVLIIENHFKNEIIGKNKKKSFMF